MWIVKGYEIGINQMQLGQTKCSGDDPKCLKGWKGF